MSDDDVERIAELERLFDRRWDADMRAIKMWQAAHPGNDLVWPDHAEMVVWLLEQLSRHREALKWFSNMLDGREHLPHTERTTITYAELWKAREALQ